MTFTAEPVDELRTMLWARIPTGKDSAIPVAELALELQVSERVVHVLVEELRDSNFPIVTAVYMPAKIEAIP